MDQRLQEITARGIVPVVVLDEAEQAVGLAEALMAGGLPVAEVTFRTAAAPEAIRRMSGVSDLLVGAGTVITPAQVDTAVEAGARFIVSPGLDAAVVERCVHHGLPIVPGAVTATEIQAALTLGLEVVKFFPAETSGGAKAIAALSAPFPGLSFVPTGGVGPTNLADYLSVASVAAVGGSWMVPRSSVRDGDFDGIAQLTREAVEKVEVLR